MTAAVSDATISDKVRVTFSFISLFLLFYEMNENAYLYVRVTRGTDLARQSVTQVAKSDGIFDSPADSNHLVREAVVRQAQLQT